MATISASSLRAACPAITQLQIAKDVVENNEPINRSEGNVEQADLELAHAENFELALRILNRPENLAELTSVSASELRAAIVISDERWDAWAKPFERALNKASAKAELKYHSWFHTKDYYCMAFAVEKGAYPFVVIGFVDSIETGSKYEFAAAWVADKAKTDPDQYIAYGSGVRFNSPAKKGELVSSGNRLAQAIAVVLNSARSQNEQRLRQDSLTALANYLQTRLSLYSLFEDQTTRNEKLRVKLEDAGIDFDVTSYIAGNEVGAEAKLALRGKPVTDKELVAAGLDAKTVKDVLSDAKLAETASKALSLSLRVRNDFEALFPVSPKVSVAYRPDYTLTVVVQVPE